eukprot:779960-Prymnesium_polylepis.1
MRHMWTAFFVRWRAGCWGVGRARMSTRRCSTRRCQRKRRRGRRRQHTWRGVSRGRRSTSRVAHQT